jgi:hypothetical protein
VSVSGIAGVALPSVRQSPELLASFEGGIAPKRERGCSLGVEFADLGMPGLDDAIALKPIVKVLPMLLSHYAMSEGRRGRKKRKEEEEGRRAIVC